VLSGFPEYHDLADEERSRVTVHNALSMTMGTDWDESSFPYVDPRNSETAMDNAPDRYRYILERPIVDRPGAHWTYCGGATALLARLITKGSGKSLHGFAREFLFAWDRRNGPPGLTVSHSLRQAPGCRFATSPGSGR
jgi:CubicO group peptidase (beta-lactamase class C family)